MTITITGAETTNIVTCLQRLLDVAYVSNHSIIGCRLAFLVGQDDWDWSPQRWAVTLPALSPTIAQAVIDDPSVLERLADSIQINPYDTRQVAVDLVSVIA